MRARVLGDDDYRRVPWRNGGGTTLELATSAQAEGPQPGWRVSIADVTADGPFSGFPGCERTSVLVEGGPLLLDFADGERRALDAPLAGCRYAGDRSVGASLPASTAARLLNVICDRARWQAEVIPFRPQGESLRHLSAAATLVLVCLEGDLDVDLRPPGSGWSLLAGETLLLEELAGSSRLTVHDPGGDAVAVLVELACAGGAS